MLTYILRRLLVAIPTILILIVLSFMLMFAAPGGPFNSDKPLPAEWDEYGTATLASAAFPIGLAARRLAWCRPK